MNTSCLRAVRYSVCESLPSSKSMLHCALWLIHDKHMECHVLSRVFLFCIWYCVIAKAKGCHEWINPFFGTRWTRSIRRNGRLIMTHFNRKRNEWIIHHWHLHSNPASTNGKNCVYISIVCLHPTKHLITFELFCWARKSKTSRERKKKCLWNCQMNNSSAYLPTK